MNARYRIPWPAVAAVAWAAMFVGTLAAFLLPRKKAPATVFPDYTAAAEHWVGGQPLYIRGGLNEFRYSPIVAAFFVPFDMLPAKLGEVIWRTVNFGALAFGLYLCCRWWVPHRFSADGVAAVFLVAVPLSYGSLNNAQSNPLVLGLLLLAAAAVTRRWFAIAALSIAVATCFKLYPVAFGMLLMLRFPWRLGWRLAVCLIAAAVLPFVLQRAAYVMDQYQQWAHYLVSEDRQRDPIHNWYLDLRAVSRVYVGHMSLPVYLIVETLSGAMIAAVCGMGLMRGWPLRYFAGLSLALATCWMTALGPATESPTYILIAPAAAWAIVEAESRGRFWRIGYGVAIGLLVVAQQAVNAGDVGKRFRDHLQPMPLAVLLLLGLLMAQAVIRLAPIRPAHPRPAD